MPPSATHLLEALTDLPGIGLGISATTKAGRTLPAGWRLEGAIGPGAVFAQLVVLGTLFRVFEHFVGLAHVRELVAGALFLAPLPMVFARRLAVGLPDVLGRSRLAQAQNGVIVFEVHVTPRI